MTFQNDTQELLIDRTANYPPLMNCFTACRHQMNVFILSFLLSGVHIKTSHIWTSVSHFRDESLTSILTLKNKEKIKNENNFV